MKIKRETLITIGVTILVIAMFALFDMRVNNRQNIEGVRVHFIDVGQGDAILIQASTGETVLIDAGVQEHLVRNYLRSLGIRTIQYVVATHPHADHIGGIPSVLSSFEVENILMPDIVHDTGAFERLIDAIERENLRITVPQPQDVFYIGEVRFTVLAPIVTAGRNMNNHSIVLRMDYGNRSFIFTGDAERESEMDMVRSGFNLCADILKIGHHGSATSTTREFLQAVNPIAAVISVGRNNMYGHPTNSVLNLLKEKDIAIYRTDHHGTILMIVYSDGRIEIIHEYI